MIIIIIMMIIIIIIIIKSLFNEDSLLKTYQIQTISACNIETSSYTTRSSSKQRHVYLCVELKTNILRVSQFYYL